MSTLPKKRVVKIKNVKPRKLQLGRTRNLRGINSNVEDIRLKGERFKGKVHDSIVSAELVRTIRGASTLTIGMADDKRRLVTNPLFATQFDLEIDDLWFRLQAIEDEGEETGILTTSFEAREVNRLRKKRGHFKVFRKQLTRAEFIMMMIRQEKDPYIPFFSPELHVVQPIRSRREERKNRQEKDDRREPGFGPGTKLTVKGARASREQMRNIETVLDVGVSLRAPFRVLVAAVACITQESNCINLGHGDAAGPSSRGLFQQQTIYYGESASDPVKASREFYAGDMAIPGGCIGYYRRNPKTTIGPMIQAVQRSANSSGSLYQQWAKEATRTVKIYLGGSDTSFWIEKTIPYSFERKKDETTWAAAQRLAEEVRWRLFETGGMVYYVTDEYLMTSRVRALLSPDSPGIDSIRSTYHGNKRVEECSIKGRARSWAAPPGTVIEIEGKGKADGRWLVEEIRSNLFNEDFEATLSRKVKHLPEPPPETKKVRASYQVGGGRGSGDAAAMVKWAVAQVGVTEGSAKHRKWAADLGYNSGDPWCSIFLAYGIKHIAKLPLPSSAAYSGAWFDWSHGKRVSGRRLQPGDFIIYDWGDGGITDHISMYIGNGQIVQGNSSNMVKRSSFSRSGVVGYVRPRYA